MHHRGLTRGRVFGALVMLVACVTAMPSRADAWVYRYLQSETTSYHYGASAYIPVVYRPAYEQHKVQAIWTHQTTLNGWVELGQAYFSGLDPTQFYSYSNYGQYHGPYFYEGCGWGTTHRYHVGYHEERHYIWINNIQKTSIPKSAVAQMTSCWPGTNNEVCNVTHTSAYNNTGSYTGLKWKSSTWGVWSSWGTASRAEYHQSGDTDRYHYQVRGSSVVNCYRD